MNRMLKEASKGVKFPCECEYVGKGSTKTDLYRLPNGEVVSADYLQLAPTGKLFPGSIHK